MIKLLKNGGIMDNLLYVLITQITCLLSFVVFIVLVIYHVVKKAPFKLGSYIVLVVCVVGMYLFVPSHLVYMGFAYQQPEKLEQAIKLSINPYEKRLAHVYMAEIYASDTLKQGIKDGNKAIEHMEKALKGEYTKPEYRLEVEMLAYWYSLKGDYKKTIELNNALGQTTGISLRSIYIMNNEYEKALETFSDNNKSIDCFLKSALYREIGDNKKAEEAIKEAREGYDHIITSNGEEWIKVNAEKYKSVDAYKKWIRQQQKEYKFIN